jgi:hypothetical protein
VLPDVRALEDRLPAQLVHDHVLGLVESRHGQRCSRKGEYRLTAQRPEVAASGDIRSSHTPAWPSLAASISGV